MSSGNRWVFMTTVALVDDDRNILTSVSMLLESEGFEVASFTDGASALASMGQVKPDLTLLDIKMPRMDGMEVLRHLRKQSSAPVIFLTSKDDEDDEVAGLRLGADDYVRKPFSQRLLIERIRAVLRRRGTADAGADTRAETRQILKRGKLEMDPLRHETMWNGRPVALTVTEFLILHALALRPGYVKSRDSLMDVAYDDQVYVDDRTIDSHIKRIRKKVRAVADDFNAIETLYGVGYRYRES